MADEFTPKVWQNDPAGATPITKAELDRMEAGIESADDRLDATEVDAESVDDRLDATETDIASADDRLDATEADISSAEDRLDAAEADVESADDRLDVTETDISSVEDRLDAAEAALTIYDDFSVRADGTLTGVTPLVGAAWLTTGAQTPAVVSGYAASTGTGYLYAAGNPDVIACDVAFGGSTTQKMMTMAWSNGTVAWENLLHFNFGCAGFSLTVRQNAGSFDVLLADNWTNALRADGTVYRFAIAVDGDRLTIIAPNGNVVATTSDPRVLLTKGAWCFWEPNASGADSAKLRSVAAYSLSAANLGANLHPSQIGTVAASVRPRQTFGAVGKRHQVALGFEPTSAMPGIAFGAPTIFARLDVAGAIGNTSITTDSPIPTGSSVQIESGTGTETVTTSASPTGAGPYVSACTTLTKAHVLGSAVVATPPANARTYMYLNAENGWFHLPPVAVLVCNTRLYFTTNVDVYLERASAGVLGIGNSGAGKGCLKTGQNTTALRPSAVTVGKGAQSYDTTLNIPIWSDGAVWRDAVGTAV